MKTPRRSRCLISILLSAFACSALGAAAKRSPVGTYISIPDTFVAGPELSADVERGLFFVPENRREPNSRVIAVHFLRFEALQKQRGARRPPVVLLPGGPGDEFDFTEPVTLRLVQRLRRTRDVLYVSQRGNPDAPGLVANLSEKRAPVPMDVPDSAERIAERQRAAFGAAVKTWSDRGIDLRGYDILNVVDDVHELHVALGYEKIVLRGCSFGSQWSFAYLKRWPAAVDRALLSGVEPLDYAYDDPKWLWASFERLARRAEADPAFAGHVPADGLMVALKTVIEHLEKTPVTVTIEEPATGKSISVTFGADDLREVLTWGAALEWTREQALGNWPRFILEMYRGDYRMLAARTWERRRQDSSLPLIGALIDNSLGISAVRDARLIARPEARWLGDINDYYHNTRHITPTPDVGDAFRADWPIDVPVLLVNGDLDWSTPIENARHARRHLKRGHLIEIEGGMHCDEDETLAGERPLDAERTYAFIDADFVTMPPEAFFATLPASLAYAPIRFAAPGGPALYEQWLASLRRGRLLN